MQVSSDTRLAEMKIPTNNRYEPIGIKEIVTRLNGGYSAYRRVSISTEL
jgi:hypothetical protein